MAAAFIFASKWYNSNRNFKEKEMNIMIKVDIFQDFWEQARQL